MAIAIPAFVAAALLIAAFAVSLVRKVRDENRAIAGHWAARAPMLKTRPLNPHVRQASAREPRGRRSAALKAFAITFEGRIVPSATN